MPHRIFSFNLKILNNLHLLRTCELHTFRERERSKDVENFSDVVVAERAAAPTDPELP